MTDWQALNTEEHYRYCTACNAESSYEYAPHSGGTATCTDCAVCSVCTGPYGELDPTHHANEPVWLNCNNTQHYRYCADCAKPIEYADHDVGGGCFGACTVCGSAEALDPNGQHDWSEWKHNGDGTHSRVCLNNADHTETLDCSFGDWTFLTHGMHERRCTVCDGQQVDDHTGGKYTCYAAPICDVCHESYGAPDRTGHPNPTYETKPATCYSNGYIHVICDEAGCVEPFLEFIVYAKGQHLYHHWQPAGNGAHIDSCQYCGENATVTCTYFEMDGFKFCPICGGYEGSVLPLLFASDADALPYGTLLVRSDEIMADGTLAITVTGSYGGKVVHLNTPVDITISVEGEGLTLVRVDMVDGIEVRTEVPYTAKDGKLTFTADAVGLFLLVPAE